MQCKVRDIQAEIEDVGDALPGWVVRPFGVGMVSIEHADGWAETMRTNNAAWFALVTLADAVNAAKPSTDPIEVDRREWDAEPRW